MPKFVIERAISNIGAASAADLQAISQKSCGVLSERYLDAITPWRNCTGYRLPAEYLIVAAQRPPD
ncbi:MAG TPA: hypothetical protein VNV16_07460 [Methylibium sp.]|jgi:hypothetical protein|nr:hypothetical protein [Methylibium sp.]